MSEVFRKEVDEKLGKTAAKYINEQAPPVNQWALYNYLTYYISHLVEQRMRPAYQIKVSKLFSHCWVYAWLYCHAALIGLYKKFQKKF